MDEDVKQDGATEKTVEPPKPIILIELLGNGKYSVEGRNIPAGVAVELEIMRVAAELRKLV